MAKDYAKKFYNSKAWKKCRESYIPKVFGLCEHCGEPGYILDHIKEITPDNITNPNITLNHDNLQFLCLECHNTKTFGKDRPIIDGLKFDENGDLVQILPKPPCNF
jgi:5-methylcytosine-specific restriction enzyme A